MKTIGLIALFMILVGSSCKKQQQAQFHPDSFMFGTVCPMCYIYSSKLYLIKNNWLYQDSNHFTPASHNFSGPPLATSKYIIATQLISTIPKAISGNQSGSLGCLGCTDGMFVHIEYTQNGKTLKWDIDPNDSTLSTELRSYIERITTVMGQL